MSIEAFREFDSEFRKIYDTLGILNLDEYDFNGENSIGYIYQIENKNNIHPYPYSLFKIHDELNFITKDIKYISGMLYFLRPHINNSYTDNGTYHQTHEDHRYLMYANWGLQSIYNFWDRLGDILFLFFETGLKEDLVYFTRVVNNIAVKWKEKRAYIELKELYENEIKYLLDSRHKAVHHFQLECKYYWDTIEFRDDLDKLKESNEEKFSYPEKMIKSLNNCMKGFKHTIDLICELPNK